MKQHENLYVGPILSPKVVWLDCHSKGLCHNAYKQGIKTF